MVGLPSCSPCLLQALKPGGRGVWGGSVPAPLPAESPETLASSKRVKDSAPIWPSALVWAWPVFSTRIERAGSVAGSAELARIAVKHSWPCEALSKSDGLMALWPMAQMGGTHRRTPMARPRKQRTQLWASQDLNHGGRYATASLRLVPPENAEPCSTVTCLPWFWKLMEGLLSLV